MKWTHHRPFRVIGRDVVELTRDLDDPQVEALLSFRSPKGFGNGSVSWFGLNYQYTKEEVAAACWFYARVTRASYKLNEDERTLYDTSYECPFCKVGRIQMSLPVFPGVSPRPAGGLAATASGDFLCQRDLAEAIARERLTGCRLLPVTRSKRDAAKMPDIVDATTATPEFIMANGQALNEAAVSDERFHVFQLVVPGTVSVSPKTKYGTRPFTVDAKGYGVCPFGHLLGHRRLSPLTVTGCEAMHADFHMTRLYSGSGADAGWFRPKRELLMSPRAASVLRRFAHKGIPIDPLDCDSESTQP